MSSKRTSTIKSSKLPSVQSPPRITTNPEKNERHINPIKANIRTRSRNGKVVHHSKNNSTAILNVGGQEVHWHPSWDGGMTHPHQKSYVSNELGQMAPVRRRLSVDSLSALNIRTGGLVPDNDDLNNPDQSSVNSIFDHE